MHVLTFGGSIAYILLCIGHRVSSMEPVGILFNSRSLFYTNLLSCLGLSNAQHVNFRIYSSARAEL
jgi:hypothetical protein